MTRLDPAADRDVAGAEDSAPYTAASSRAVERIDELIYDRIDSAGDGDSILDLLKAPAPRARSCATSS